MQIHNLKCDPEEFDKVLSCAKKAEIRINDRNFQIDDHLQLWKTTHSFAEMQAGALLRFTGAVITRQVTDITTGYGMPEGCVMLSLRPLFMPEVAVAPAELLPIPLVLHCPECGMQHIDRDGWEERPHRSHRCENCGNTWRPADMPTRGVEETATKGEYDTVPKLIGMPSKLLRDKIGKAISEEIHSGAESPDWFDSREIDRLANAAMGCLLTHKQVDECVVNAIQKTSDTMLVKIPDRNKIFFKHVVVRNFYRYMEYLQKGGI